MKFLKWLGIFIFAIVTFFIANLTYDYFKIAWYESALEDMVSEQIVLEVE